MRRRPRSHGLTREGVSHKSKTDRGLESEWIRVQGVDGLEVGAEPGRRSRLKEGSGGSLMLRDEGASVRRSRTRNVAASRRSPSTMWVPRIRAYNSVTGISVEAMSSVTFWGRRSGYRGHAIHHSLRVGQEVVRVIEVDPGRWKELPAAKGDVCLLRVDPKPPRSVHATRGWPQSSRG